MSIMSRLSASREKSAGYQCFLVCFHLVMSLTNLCIFCFLPCLLPVMFFWEIYWLSVFTVAFDSRDATEKSIDYQWSLMWDTIASSSRYCRRWRSRMQVKIVVKFLFVLSKISQSGSIVKHINNDQWRKRRRENILLCHRENCLSLRNLLIISVHRFPRCYWEIYWSPMWDSIASSSKYCRRWRSRMRVKIVVKFLFFLSKISQSGSIIKYINDQWRKRRRDYIVISHWENCLSLRNLLIISVHRFPQCHWEIYWLSVITDVGFYCQLVQVLSQVALAHAGENSGQVLVCSL